MEQISWLLGYNKAAVNRALQKFEAAGLVRRSRSSNEICFSQLVASVDTARQDSFELLVNLFDKPVMRHLVAGRLPRPLPARGGLRRAGLYLT
jgi:DNA-binding IclR family transcriptional regulator